MEYVAFFSAAQRNELCYGSNIENLRIITTRGRSQKQKEFLVQIPAGICKLDQDDKAYQKSPGKGIGMQKWGHHGRDGCFAYDRFRTFI